MKNLCNSAMLKEITPVIYSIHYRESALPSAVFLPRLKYVDFMPFEAVLMPEFFNKLISFVKCVKEADFFMVSIAPAIEDHVRDFTSVGYFKFDISDSAEEYLSALHHYPKESRADALAFHASQILFSSKSARWAALADRDSDLVIWGFEEEFI